MKIMIQVEIRSDELDLAFQLAKFHKLETNRIHDISRSFAVLARALFWIKITIEILHSIRSARHFSDNWFSLYGISFFANWKIIEFAFRLSLEVPCLYAFASATRFENIGKDQNAITAGVINSLAAL